MPRDSIRNHITWERVFNSALMLKRAKPLVLLLLEGDADARFFKTKIIKDSCHLIISHSKDNAVKAFNKLSDAKTLGILAILDHDYWVLENAVIEDSNIIYYDYHDLEVMLLKSPALQKYLIEIFPADRIERLEDFVPKLVLSLFSLGCKIGCVRWLNDRQKLFLCFEDLPYERFCDFQTLEVNLKTLYEVVSISQGRPKISFADFQNAVNELVKKNSDPDFLCQGHDLVNLLRFVLPNTAKKMLGSSVSEHVERKIARDNIEKGLRLSYSKKDFQETSLFKRLLNWESENSKEILDKGF